MKLLKTICLLTIATIVLFSCKKDQQINWEQELRGTSWSGEYLVRYSNGDIFQHQTFTVSLNANHTALWNGLWDYSKGFWAVNGDTINVTFLDGKGFTAIISKNSFSNFENPPLMSQKIISLVKTVVPNPDALVNSIWNIKFEGGDDVTIKFMTDNKLNYVIADYYNNPPREPSYTVLGAGILFYNFSYKYPTSRAYLIFQNDSIKAYTETADRAPVYYTYGTGTKQ